MSPLFHVMISEIIAQDLVDMSGVKHEHVVETLASDGAYEALNEGILPG